MLLRNCLILDMYFMSFTRTNRKWSKFLKNKMKKLADKVLLMLMCKNTFQTTKLSPSQTMKVSQVELQAFPAT